MSHYESCFQLAIVLDVLHAHNNDGKCSTQPVSVTIVCIVSGRPRWITRPMPIGRVKLPAGAQKNLLFVFHFL